MRSIGAALEVSWYNGSPAARLYIMCGLKSAPKHARKTVLGYKGEGSVCTKVRFQKGFVTPTDLGAKEKHNKPWRNVVCMAFLGLRIVFNKSLKNQ